MALFCPPWLLWIYRNSSYAPIWWICAAIYGAFLHHLVFDLLAGDRPIDPPSLASVNTIELSPSQEAIAEANLSKPLVQITAPVSPQQHVELKRLMSGGHWDAARQTLQKMAYDMPNASTEEKVMFAYYAAEFAKLDPLFKSVLASIVPAVQAQPGIKQTEVYSLVPHTDTETVRYVLYYAHMLNLIERRKKGATYQLFPYIEGISKPWEGVRQNS